MALLLAVAGLGLGALVAASPPTASADYEVEICSNDSQAGDGITITDDGSASSITTLACAQAFEAHAIFQEAGHTVRGGQHWTLNAPPDTKIHELELNRLFSRALSWAGGMEWRLVTGRDAGFRMLDHLDENFEPLPPFGHVTYEVDSESVTGRMLCVFIECNTLTPFVALSSVVAIVEDLSPPTVTAAGPLLAGGPIRGVREVSVAGDDQGSGIAEAALFVDGEPQAKSTDDNEGKCKQPYKVLAPCRKHVDSTFSLDTSTVDDGPHLVEVAAVDAAGQVAFSPPAIVTVHNAPTNTAPPALSGAAGMGGRLSASHGDWEGAPTSFAYRWLRCDPSASAVSQSSCDPIPGATGPDYQPQAADVYQRLAVQVIARNSSGPESAFSALSEIVPDAHGLLAPDATPPVLKASLSRRLFRVGSARAGRSAHRAPRGAVLRFSSSEAGRLLLALAPAKRGRRGRPSVVVRTIEAGRGRIAIGARFGRRPLTAGRYRLTAIAVDVAGNASKPTRLSFTVVPG